MSANSAGTIINEDFSVDGDSGIFTNNGVTISGGNAIFADDTDFLEKTGLSTFSRGIRVTFNYSLSGAISNYRSLWVKLISTTPGNNDGYVIEVGQADSIYYIAVYVLTDDELVDTVFTTTGAYSSGELIVEFRDSANSYNIVTKHNSNTLDTSPDGTYATFDEVHVTAEDGDDPTFTHRLLDILVEEF